MILNLSLQNKDGTNVMDGHTMLLIILKRIMPRTKGGVSNKKRELIGMTPAKFGGDVGAMITKMQTLKSSIENESGKDYDDFTPYLFSTCGRCTNETFQKFASGLSSDWESDNLLEGTTDTKVIDLLITKWNNESSMKSKGGGTLGASVEDPANAKIMAFFFA